MTFDAVIHLQECDTLVDQLRHRLEHLPGKAELAAAVAAEAAVVAELGPLSVERAAVAAEQRRLEHEVTTVEAKIEHVKDQLYGGAVVAPKELEALQHELGTLHDRQVAFEDDVLVQMEAAEPLDARIAALGEALEERRGEVSVAEAELEVAVTAATAMLSDATGDRELAAVNVPEELMAAYEGLRRRLGGVGAARLEGSRCLGCHLEIPAAELAAIRKAPPDELVLCPECGRILAR